MAGLQRGEQGEGAGDGGGNRRVGDMGQVLGQLRGGVGCHFGGRINQWVDGGVWDKALIAGQLVHNPSLLRL